MQKKSNHIEIEGISYIPVKEAALLAEYTADYVGQLCRGGKLDATKIGRSWYVSEESIIAHKESKTEPVAADVSLKEEIDAQDQVIKKPLKRSSRNLTPKTIFTDSSFIVYQRDDRPLIPRLNALLAETDNEISPNRDSDQNNDIKQEDILQIPYQEPKLLLPKFSTLFAPLMAFASFAIVFLLVFSLNGSYTGELIGNGVNNVVASVANTEAGETIDSDIMDPMRAAAISFSEYVDEKVLQTIYGKEIYEELYKR